MPPPNKSPLGRVPAPRTPSKPAVQAPAAAPLQGLPLNPGSLHLTPAEEAQLAEFGWKRGDPIPSNLPALVAAARANTNPPDPVIAPEMIAKFKPPVPDQVIEFGDLSPERQAEIKSAFAQVKAETDAERARRAARLPEAPPGVNEAIQKALANPVPFIDDLPKVEAPRQSAPPRAVPPTPAQIPAPAASELTDEGAGGAVALKNCPHCGWQLDLEEQAVPTADDKLTWLVAQEGGKRFRKRYSLLGGRIVVTFRSLTALESDTAWRQVAVDGSADMRERALASEGQYWTNLMVYRLVMGLESVWSATNETQNNPEYKDWVVDPGAVQAPNTALSVIVPLVTETLFPTETLRRQIGAAFHRFQLLVDHLEARADDDPFWSGIGLRP